MRHTAATLAIPRLGQEGVLGGPSRGRQTTVMGRVAPKGAASLAESLENSN